MADIDSARTEGGVMDFDTTLRCLGYGIDFIQILALPVLLAAITWRLAR
jgi:hypothetical protein